MRHEELIEILRFCSKNKEVLKAIASNPTLDNVESYIGEVYDHLKRVFKGLYKEIEYRDVPIVVKARDYQRYLYGLRMQLGTSYWNHTTVGDIYMEYVTEKGYKMHDTEDNIESVCECFKKLEGNTDDEGGDALGADTYGCNVL